MKKGVMVTLCLAISVFIISGCVTPPTIKVESMPAKAEILLRGERVGWTPKDIQVPYDSKNPKVQIEVKKEGFNPETKTLEFKDIKNNTYLPFELTPEMRRVDISAKTIGSGEELEGAEVYIGNKKIGVTPLKQFEIAFVDPSTGNFNEVTLRAKLNDYQAKDQKDWAEEVLTYDDNKNEVAFELEKVLDKEVVIHEIKEEIVKGMKRFILRPRKVIAHLDVIERSPNVKSVTQVTSFQGKVELGGPVVSPDSKTLLSYARSTERKENTLPSPAYLWSMNLGGGTGITTITHSKIGFGDIEPTFSPDNKYIYFSSDREGEALTLWRIKSTGAGGLTKMTASGASDREPNVTRDDTKIVYSSLPVNAQIKQVWTVNTNGFLPTQLREGHSPKFSPDGKSIVFLAEDKTSGKEKIWVMSADGANPTQLTFSEAYDDSNPAWSPDGKKIVFASDRGLDLKGRQNFDIWVMNADGSEVTQLTTNGSMDDYPAWDPLGKYIYFRSNRGGNWEIWRIDIS